MTAATISAEQAPSPPSKLLTLTEGPRALGELAAFYALRPLLNHLPHGDGHGVLVLPGFMASDASTAPMRSLLTDLGYEVAGWDLGRNVRITNRRVAAMGEALVRLYERTGAKAPSSAGAWAGCWRARSPSSIPIWSARSSRWAVRSSPIVATPASPGCSRRSTAR